MQDAIIEIRDLNKIYPLYRKRRDRVLEALNFFSNKVYHEKFFALKNISLQVKKGECLGIIGLNGSGKSTLLQIIAGVIHPSSGEVKVKGSLAALLELGAGFNPEFTGEENVMFQCSMMGLTQKESKILLPEIIAFADIGNFLYQPVKTYSSGMYVRLAFAVSICVDPDILIVDEALAVGDIKFQAKCMKKISEFKSKGKTLLFVSHDASAVKALSDRAILLESGKILSEGDPKEVFNFYNARIAEKENLEASTSKKSRIELNPSKNHRSGSGKVEILNTKILREENLQSSEVYQSGEIARIEVHVRAHEDVEDLSIGILIRDRFGNDIFGCNSYQLGHYPLRMFRDERRKFCFTMPLDLGNHLYTLTVAAHAGENHIEENYDWIDEALVFKVIPDPHFKFAGYAKLNPRFSSEEENS